MPQYPGGSIPETSAIAARDEGDDLRRRFCCSAHGGVRARRAASPAPTMILLRLDAVTWLMGGTCEGRGGGVVCSAPCLGQSGARCDSIQTTNN
jgi:hypothetical protein